MLPNFLLPEHVAQSNGNGPVLDVTENSGKLLVLTLGITRIVEQESLDLLVWGSSDGEVWDAKPLVAFPQKFYCGVYSVLLNLSGQPHVRYLRTSWKMNRWGRGELVPMFGFYVVADVSGSRLANGSAAVSSELYPLSPASTPRI